MESKPCAHCGALFKPRRAVQKLCGRQCNGHARGSAKKLRTFACEYCGKITERRRNHLGSYDYTTRFCSRECGYKGRKWRPISSDGHIHSTGYRRIDLRGGKKAYQHRLVMEKILDRPLHKGENVHHKDGNRLNNDPSNLELWTKIQPPGQRVVDKIAFAIEMLQTYPKFAAARGFKLVPI